MQTAIDALLSLFLLFLLFPSFNESAQPKGVMQSIVGRFTSIPKHAVNKRYEMQQALRSNNAEATTRPFDLATATILGGYAFDGRYPLKYYTCRRAFFMISVHFVAYNEPVLPKSLEVIKNRLTFI